MPKTKSALASNLEYYPLMAMILLLRAMPLRLARLLAAALARLFYWLDAKHRVRSVQHLLHAGVAKDVQEARRLAKANFRHLANVGVDIVKFDQFLNTDNFAEHVTRSYDPGAEAALNDPGRSIILVSAHFGNWEISGLACSILHKPILSVMRHFDNPKLGAYILSRRQQFRQTLQDKKNALKPLLKALKSGQAVGMLCDQHAGSLEGVETVFFGHPARTHASPALLHLKTGAPLILGLAKRLDDNFHYELIAKGPITIEPSGDQAADVQRLAQAYTTEIEKMVASCPEQWLWSHRRWLDLNRRKRD